MPVGAGGIRFPFEFLAVGAASLSKKPIAADLNFDFYGVSCEGIIQGLFEPFAYVERW